MAAATNTCTNADRVSRQNITLYILDVASELLIIMDQITTKDL